MSLRQPLVAVQLHAAVPTPYERLEAENIRRWIDRQLTTLTPREEAIIRRRFGFDGGDEESIRAIAVALDGKKQFSQSYYRTKERHAIRKLRQRLRDLREEPAVQRELPRDWAPAPPPPPPPPPTHILALTDPVVARRTHRANLEMLLLIATSWSRSPPIVGCLFDVWKAITETRAAIARCDALIK